MSRFSLFIIVIFHINISSCNAQDKIELNMNFEDWEISENSIEPYTDTFIPRDAEFGIPTNWTCFGGKTMIRTTDAQNGDYAVVMTDWYNPFGEVLINGKCNGVNHQYPNDCMSPINYLPNSISGYHKFLNATGYNSVNDTRTVISTVFLNIDTINNKIDTISSDTLILMPSMGTQASYEEFKIIINKRSNLTPTHFNIFFDFYVDYQNGENNDCDYCYYHYLDNLKLNTLSNSISLNSLQGESFSIYPNPAENIFQISNLLPVKQDIILYSLDGKYLRTLSLSANESVKDDLTGYSGLFIAKSLLTKSIIRILKI